MTTATTCTVKATRWEHGWELYLDGEVVTQCRALSQAEQQVRDYLDTVEPEIDHASWKITIVPDLGGLEVQVRDSRHATEAARRATETAAAQSRQVAAALRDANIPGVDAAWLLKITTSRLSQLAPRRPQKRRAAH